MTKKYGKIIGMKWGQREREEKERERGTIQNLFSWSDSNSKKVSLSEISPFLPILELMSDTFNQKAILWFILTLSQTLEGMMCNNNPSKSCHSPSWKNTFSPNLIFPSPSLSFSYYICIEFQPFLPSITSENFYWSRRRKEWVISYTFFAKFFLWPFDGL